jgi:dGTP triphosphohydrolase
MDKEIDTVNELVKEVHAFDESQNIQDKENKYTEGLDMTLFSKSIQKKEVLTITHIESVEFEEFQVAQTIDLSNLTDVQKKEKLKTAVNKFVRENVKGLEDFDYEIQKDTSSLLITIKWKNILQNLMEICEIQNKSKIKANVWKPFLKEMERDSQCINKVEWR